MFLRTGCTREPTGGLEGHAVVGLAIQGSPFISVGWGQHLRFSRAVSPAGRML